VVRPSRPRLPAVLASVLFLLLAGMGQSVRGQEMSVQERQQASLAVRRTVLGILSFVHWPQRSGALTLCVTGNTQFAGGFSSDAYQSNGEALHVRHYLQDSQGARADAPAPADVPPLECNVLYLGRLSLAVQRRLFERFLRRPTLLISEVDKECAVGNMFCLLISARQVSFNVNLDSLARSPLRVHPNVLKLARGKP